jgi:oligoribonuclease
MAQDQNSLVWLDMEMTGLDPDQNRIIELAMVVTDSALNVVAEAPVWVVHQSAELMGAMDEWNRNTHGRSGLTAKVLATTTSEAEVETEALAFLKAHVPARTTPMCGNSICQDRRFMARYMPQLEDWFHYRNLDVSTLKELCKRWRPALAKELKKHGRHEALADIYESIDELRFYRDRFLRLD